MSNVNHSKKNTTNLESSNRARVHLRIGARAGQGSVFIAFVTQTACQLEMIVALSLITAKEAKDHEVAVEWSLTSISNGRLA